VQRLLSVAEIVDRIRPLAKQEPLAREAAPGARADQLVRLGFD
jgi:hypothetical protein